MQKFVSVALCALGLAFGASAHAAPFLDFNGSTGVFGNDLVASPTFDDMFDLGSLSPGDYLISATISSSFQTGAQADQDIDFTSVTLNDKPFTIGNMGQFEFRYITNAVALGTNLFKISGTSGSNSSYAGTINIASVPEPTTWATFLIGFGVIGFAMRRSRGSRRALRGQLL